ncbi:hypothetical protein O6H91_Y282100 [Diphasiastrum complanatum]|nr:hypothetical protein O6H91_Y282100 [Diphasiastrum complanatum]
MGCAGSKIDNEEGVVQCRARRRAIRQSVASRHAFAAAHAAYVQSLKNIGAAFKQFAETELWEEAALENPTPPRKKTLRPPPPPPPTFLPPPSPPRDNLKRAVSLPPLMLDQKSNKMKHLTPPTSPREEGKEAEKQYFYGDVPRPPPPPLPATNAPPPPPPSQSSTWDFYDPFRIVEPHIDISEPRKAKQVLETVGEQAESGYAQEDESASEWQGTENEEERQEKHEERYMSEKDAALLGEAEVSSELLSTPRKDLAIVGPPPKTGMDFLKALQEVDNLFMRAYESGKAIALTLEARKVHYHSNFVDPKGFNDHSSKVLNAISWGHWSNDNRTPLAPQHERPDENGAEGRHAATLDRLFAWEKKLHDEVKQSEVVESLEDQLKATSYFLTKIKYIHTHHGHQRRSNE